jgi:hypothetical protein
MGYAIFIPWMVCQMAISRLLLDVKTLKAFTKQQQRCLANTASHELKPTRTKEPKTVTFPPSQRLRRDNSALYPSFSAAMSQQSGGGGDTEHPSDHLQGDPRSRFSSTDEYGHVDSWQGVSETTTYANSVGRKSETSSGDERSSSKKSQTWFTRLVSWLMNPADKEIYVMVNIDSQQEHDTGGVEDGREQHHHSRDATTDQNQQPNEQTSPQGGLKVSRLGRFDEWVY